MAMETSTSTQTTSIDPAIQPYLSYGLSEAQRLYGVNAAPNATTQQAIEAMKTRALAGSPLIGAAQGQLASTIGGDYLSGNPFFQGAFQPAAQAATTAFNTAIGDVTSQASKAGRYGSGAMTNLQNAAAGQLAQKLTGTAGQLAYQNYADERARQQAATVAAPAFAEQDYSDISKLMAAGQAQQQFPQQALTNYLSAVYGQPMGRTSTTTSPYYTNPMASALGTGLLGLQFANAASPYAKSASNWLSGQWDSYANPITVDTSGSGLSEMFGGVDTGSYGGAFGLQIR